jgi:Resolvase, N terminal domain
VFTVLGAVAELERSLIVERVRAGLRNPRAKGQRLGRPRIVVDRVTGLPVFAHRAPPCERLRKKWACPLPLFTNPSRKGSKVALQTKPLSRAGFLFAKQMFSIPRRDGLIAVQNRSIRYHGDLLDDAYGSDVSIYQGLGVLGAGIDGAKSRPDRV